jgi:hypothetical protein
MFRKTNKRFTPYQRRSSKSSLQEETDATEFIERRTSWCADSPIDGFSVAIASVNDKYFFNVGQRYIIQDTVGEGSYGIVKKAIDTTTNSIVAIKKLLSPFQEGARKSSMEREVAALQLLKHPNVRVTKKKLIFFSRLLALLK